jgi:hypothetical protein
MEVMRMAMMKTSMTVTKGSTILRRRRRRREMKPSGRLHPQIHTTRYAHNTTYRYAGALFKLVI